MSAGPTVADLVRDRQTGRLVAAWNGRMSEEAARACFAEIPDAELLARFEHHYPGELALLQDEDGTS